MIDKEYMGQALVLAKRAGKRGEVPIGALVVSPTGVIIGRGSNRVEKQQCQVYHAEMVAIQNACKTVGTWHLDECTLYVTLEPCMMCISLSALSRIQRIVYGAESPLFGYRLDKEGVLALYTKQIKNITADVLAQEAAAVLRDFFTQKRKSRDK